MATKKKAKKKAAKKLPAKKKAAKKQPVKKKAANKKKPPAKSTTSDRQEPAQTEISGKPGAPFGNQFWKARKSHGRPRLFATPDDLWSAAVEYFEWNESNPHMETKTFSYEGIAFDHDVGRMRALTIQGLCFYLGISRSTWDDYRKKDDFSIITEDIENVMFEQKFSGAAAGLLNANLVARDLSLRDGTELTGKGGKPIQTEGTVRRVLITMPDNGRGDANYPETDAGQS